MVAYYILIGVLFVLLLLSEARFFMSERRWASERAILCNRIQAGTLAEYASYRGVVEPAKPVAASNVAQDFAEIDRTSFENATAMDVDAVASAQNSYADVMG